MLKVDDVQGVWLEIDGEELEQVKFIAVRRGTSLSEAISIAIKNFLTQGVQTPNYVTPSHFA